MIVEDDPGLQSQLKWSFDGYEVHIAGDRVSAVNLLRKTSAPVVTLDLGLPPDPTNVSEGFATLQEILNLIPQTKVIVVTGNDDRVNALKAIDLGAYDFYQKPIDPDVLRVIIERAFHVHGLEEENRGLSKFQRNSPLDGVVANSPEMLEVCRVIEKISPTSITALLLGESGTGKEILARAIHGLSDRKDQRFAAINCASIPENLLESELYGYEKGAFTGAAKRTIGKIESANGGTLFLDEIGDMPIGLQAKMLRFLQERVIERVGGREEIPVDIRVVCATNQDLQEKIESGEFREDLYYRISEIIINIPPLRERAGDAVLLAWSFLTKYAKQGSSRVTGFTKEALAAIEEYRWPGNVRELENRIKRAIVMADDQLITHEELQLSQNNEEAMPINLREVRERAEARAIIRAMSYVGGNVSKAADLLGVSRPTLYDLVNKYGLK
ncbi:MAG: PEP-CTERM-box response regulator transcription factor [Candidatus Thiodiazotropha sp. (ex Dulcina madagascariensis)]|nr:PEP-CTERM-box response regulator transcription factor [Candidatus Thiodiazotropha sp. (ex Dulcina madagascariensis)]MCU7925320.1 PEP-CTERM-box response regulator transcription factor [Candidatus Thiodiazotropha sp. (ex Dulcina madagascariensis)]